MKKFMLATFGWAALGIAPNGWAQPERPLAFEIATVKPSAPDDRGSMDIQPGVGLVMKAATLKQLVALAYDLLDIQISGGPGWIDKDRFNVEAKSEVQGNALDFRSMTEAQLENIKREIRAQMQSLLADRFQLKARQETLEMPIYVLVQYKGGSKLHRAMSTSALDQRMRIQRGMLTCVSSRVESLTNTLTNILGRPVIDKTGLTGKFDWKLEWTPESGPGQQPIFLNGQPVNPPDVSGPSIFTALREQLGLKLESQRGPAPILIIDRAEKPSAN